ncbi:ATPase, P-type (transporting), HAD superfamily, subfamily IC/heavy metal translocating P-type ATPase [Acetitomaculum ruminis DSM 5522]|uniref:Cd(2+)-exporting ATPase n=2 Tax=Acetitomaculum ruminis TaxID=2382 RepID=A0A1I0VU57_9FIRM|nr:heavy metal translocating P-type ATPase [Acetitomaculum ruminis]SFA79842.1 ATPase, P-type (transporting), HAD superfamily, subfamily IC/heavy metal translocating P-type ATPase [Acetitomaculum ruminis DSM 5522]
MLFLKDFSHKIVITTLEEGDSMRFIIKHEIKNRLRIEIVQKSMTYRQADTLQYFFDHQNNIVSAKVNKNTNHCIINYTGDRELLIKMLKEFSYDSVEVSETYLSTSGRETYEVYKEKLIMNIFWRMVNKVFMPLSFKEIYAVLKSVKHILKGLNAIRNRKMEVSILDAVVILVSLIRNDINTATSVMFLLDIGEILEEWTHKKSVDDLARSMSLNVDKVWLVNDGNKLLVPAESIKEGDLVKVHMGNVIPFDGQIADGDAMVNQASLTGESMPVRKTLDGYAYAGTVVEEGEITIRVNETNGSSKYDKIVTMIEESEKLKSSIEGRAGHLADKLVPFTFVGTGLVYLFTRNITKALSVLMVDFSCALKLSIPITVLSAIREASEYSITVKGGKYLEAIADAKTIVFDKTGTLTKAEPTVTKVVAFNGYNEDEMLRLAACLEEHFPHSMAKAVVNAAKEKSLVHEEMHSRVEYIVAHGIVSKVDNKKVLIGSYHFVFEDEKCVIPEEYMEKFKTLPEEYSRLYLAIDGKLAAVVCIEDPVRDEAKEVIESLRQKGIEKCVMMTGDSKNIAKVIAKNIGLDEYYAEVLPENKALFVEKEKESGKKVIMIGDGINDSPALSVADAGIAICDGAEIAKEIADVTIGAENLMEIVILKRISDALMKKIDRNYRFILVFNSGLIGLGVLGIIAPASAALLHNVSTILISLNGMKNLLPA